MQTRDLVNQQTRDFVSALRFFCAFVLLLTATTTAALAEEREVGAAQSRHASKKRSTR